MTAGDDRSNCGTGTAHGPVSPVDGGATAPAGDAPEPRMLSFWQLLALHLAPGVLFSSVLIAVSDVFVRHGLTAYLAELVLIPACLAPTLLGILWWWTRRCDEGSRLSRVLPYSAPGTIGDYVGWPLLLYAAWGLLSLALVPFATWWEGHFVGWFPSDLGTQALIDGVAHATPEARQVTLVLAILFSGVLAPLVEEAYFRGFLLPRMANRGWMAPVASAFLFGLYHFFTPWSLPVIFVAFLPVAFVVRARRNFRISMVLHMLFNLTGVITLFFGTKPT
jgi:membrane protease YdiL (CAAX protease family)